MSSSTTFLTQSRGARCSVKTKKIRTTHPFWYWVKKDAKRHDAFVDSDNRQFLDKVIKEKKEAEEARRQSPLNQDLLPSERKEWTEQSRRVGLICKKIGILPYWTKEGRRGLTTLLQLVDNHVIKAYTAEEYAKQVVYQKRWITDASACIVMGAESMDPRQVTQEYAGLFKEAAVLPKKKLTAMYVTDDALLKPGTPLLHQSLSSRRLHRYLREIH